MKKFIWKKKAFNARHAKNPLELQLVLKAHERIHTGEIPHECMTCKKRFNQMSSLNKHERMHTGKERFKNI